MPAAHWRSSCIGQSSFFVMLALAAKLAQAA
jgi:hypothetical protein